MAKMGQLRGLGLRCIVESDAVFSSTAMEVIQTDIQFAVCAASVSASRDSPSPSQDFQAAIHGLISILACLRYLQ